MDGNIKNVRWPDPLLINHDTNTKLSAFAQVGLLSEEKVGEDEQGRPIYRYDLTDKGREYVEWYRGMNFCFGRVIVERDTITTRDTKVPESGDKRITYKYHYENVPDWVTSDVIKNLNDQNYRNYRDALYKGHGVGGNFYIVDYDNWKLIWTISGLTVP